MGCESFEPAAMRPGEPRYQSCRRRGGGRKPCGGRAAEAGQARDGPRGRLRARDLRRPPALPRRDDLRVHRHDDRPRVVEVPVGDLAGPDGRLRGPAALHLRRPPGRVPALVPRRDEARVHVEPGRREGGAALRPARRGRRGREAHRRSRRAWTRSRGPPTGRGSPSPRASATTPTTKRTTASASHVTSRRSSTGSTASAGRSTVHVTSSSVPSDGSAEPKQLTDGASSDSSARMVARLDADRVRLGATQELGHRPVVRHLSRRARRADVRRSSRTPTRRAAHRRGRRTARRSPTTASPDRGSWGTKHTQVAVIDVASREWKVLTSSLDRNCSPFMAGREPMWLGKRILFAIEDHGNNALYTVPGGGGRKPEQVLGGNIRLGGYDIANGMGVHIQTTPTALPEVYCGDKRLTHFGKDFAAATNAREADALHREVGGRLRRRGVDHEAGELRRGTEVPRPAEHPRGPVHAVRQHLLRRVPGVHGGRLRRRLLEPARVVRLLAGLGRRDQRTGARRLRLGDGRLPGPHGRHRHRARRSTTSAIRSASA